MMCLGVLVFVCVCLFLLLTVLGFRVCELLCDDACWSVFVC